MLNIALPKGRLGDTVYDIFEAVGYGCPAIREGGRKLVFESEENGVRFFWVKPSDVAIYVERGAADVGVAGKDILLSMAGRVYFWISASASAGCASPRRAAGTIPTGRCASHRSFPHRQDIT